MPIFNLDLGWHFEMFMTIPGIWFGAPPISTGLWPSLVAAVVSGQFKHYFLFFLIFSAYLAWWTRHMNNWLTMKLEDYPTKGITLAYHPFGDDGKKNSIAYFVIPNIPLLLTWLISDADLVPFTAACFTVTCQLVCMLTCEMSKHITRRNRPIVALSE